MKSNTNNPAILAAYEDGPMHCGGLQHKNCPDDRCLEQCSVCGTYGRHETEAAGWRCFAVKYPELGVRRLEMPVFGVFIVDDDV